jgi:hypothetical protein
VISNLVDAEEAARIAEELIEKYGNEALDFVNSRAERASEVGDDLAYAAWQNVLDATQTLLDGSPAAAY